MDEGRLANNSICCQMYKFLMSINWSSSTPFCVFVKKSLVDDWQLNSHSESRTGVGDTCSLEQRIILFSWNLFVTARLATDSEVLVESLCHKIVVRADAYLIGLKNIPTSVSNQAGFGPASGFSHCIVPNGVMHTWSGWSAQSGSKPMSMYEDRMNWAEDQSSLNFNEMFFGNCDF